MKRKALTLIEVIIAVGVLTLVAAFVVPTYQLILSQLQLNSATAQVADFMRTAQQRTVTEQQPYGVTLASGANSVPLYLFNASNGTKATQTTLSLPSYITITQVNFGGATDIRFASSGAPTSSGSVVLTDSTRNRSRQIDLRPSGAVLNNQAEF